MASSAPEMRRLEALARALDAIVALEGGAAAAAAAAAEPADSLERRVLVPWSGEPSRDTAFYAEAVRLGIAELEQHAAALAEATS